MKSISFWVFFLISFKLFSVAPRKNIMECEGFFSYFPANSIEVKSFREKLIQDLSRAIKLHKSSQIIAFLDDFLLPNYFSFVDFKYRSNIDLDHYSLEILKKSLEIYKKYKSEHEIDTLLGNLYKNFLDYYSQFNELEFKINLLAMSKPISYLEYLSLENIYNSREFITLLINVFGNKDNQTSKLNYVLKFAKVHKFIQEIQLKDYSYSQIKNALLEIKELSEVEFTFIIDSLKNDRNSTIATLKLAVAFIDVYREIFENFPHAKILLIELFGLYLDRDYFFVNHLDQKAEIQEMLHLQKTLDDIFKEIYERSPEFFSEVLSIDFIEERYEFFLYHGFYESKVYAVYPLKEYRKFLMKLMSNPEYLHLTFLTKQIKTN